MVGYVYNPEAISLCYKLRPCFNQVATGFLSVGEFTKEL